MIKSISSPLHNAETDIKTDMDFTGKNMPESISFGTWLRQHRRALDLTQKALADQVGCAEITVRRMEADEYKPSNELALVLFEKLGIPEPERPQWVRFARGLANIQTITATPFLPREQKTNLPIPLTSFIGREKDIERIQHKLAEHRLVTLIGAGGIGKTRLSQQVASQLMTGLCQWRVAGGAGFTQ